MDDGASGRHRRLRVEVVAPQPADRSRGESELSRRAISRKRPTRPIARASPDCRARSCRSSIASRSRSWRKPIRGCSRSRAARSITVNLPPELSDRALDPSNRLKPDYAARGVTLERLTQPALQYAYFNMQDPVVGGYTNDKVALRRALVMGFNNDELIRVVYQGQALPATQPIPPNVPGSRRHAERRGAVRSRGGAKRCSTSSATSIATATAGATCPTASR